MESRKNIALDMIQRGKDRAEQKRFERKSVDAIVGIAQGAEVMRFARFAEKLAEEDVAPGAVEKISQHLEKISEITGSETDDQESARQEFDDELRALRGILNNLVSDKDSRDFYKNLFEVAGTMASFNPEDRFDIIEKNADKRGEHELVREDIGDSAVRVTTRRNNDGKNLYWVGVGPSSDERPSFTMVYVGNERDDALAKMKEVKKELQDGATLLDIDDKFYTTLSQQVERSDSEDAKIYQKCRMGDSSLAVGWDNGYNNYTILAEYWAPVFEDEDGDILGGYQQEDVIIGNKAEDARVVYRMLLEEIQAGKNSVEALSEKEEFIDDQGYEYNKRDHSL